MLKNTKFLKISFFLILLSLYFFIPHLIQAKTDPGDMGGGLSVPSTEDWDGDCVDNGVATLQGFECIYRNLLRILIPLGGLAAFVVILLGGFQYITSAGDPKQAQKASGVITGAIIGLVVAVGIWFLFQILNGVTGLDLLRFAVPGP